MGIGKYCYPEHFSNFVTEKGHILSVHVFYPLLLLVVKLPYIVWVMA
jgi:hypothetical protein